MYPCKGLTWRRFDIERWDATLSYITAMYLAVRLYVSLSVALCVVCVDLSLEDSGNYTCEVRGPRANTLGDVTHYIFIRGM